MATALTFTGIGCGGGDTEGPEALTGEAAEQALADAARNTNETAETVQASLTGSIEGLPTGDEELGLEGFIDPVSESGSFEVNTGELNLDLILLDGTAYVSSDEPAFADALPEGAEWVEVAPEEFESIGLVTTFGEQGFTPQLYLALGAIDVKAGEIEEVGDDPVRSYDFGIDREEAVEEAPAAARSFVEDAITLEGESPSVEGSATIDDEGRMRRFTAVGTVQPSGDPSPGDGELRVTLEVDYLQFGVDVSAQAPAEEITVPLAEAPDAVAALGQLDGAAAD